MKKKFSVGLAISGLCLYLVFRNTDLGALRESLVAVHYSYLFISLIFIFLFTFFRALRWKFILDPLKKISTRNLFEVVMIGNLANNILPARIGEVVRAVVLGKTEGISKIASLATIVMERILDVITLVIILIIASRYLPLGGSKNNIIIIAATASVCFLSLFLILLKYRQEWLFKTSKKFLEPISPKIALHAQKSLHNFLEGLQVLKQGKHLIAISFLSGIIGLVLGAIYYFVAIGFDIKLSLPGLLFLLSVICLGIMIPSSPGFIGTFHYFCIQALFLLGVKDKNLALSYAIVVHLIQYIPESLLGLLFFWKKGFSLREIKTAEIQTE